jgi:cholest-4-en-3-one 26-monooxygenase
MNANLDLDVSNPDSFAAGFPHEHFRRLRAEDPVHWHEGDVHGGPGYWIVSRYDDLKWVSKNPALFVSGRGNLIEDPQPGELDVTRSMITMDPPDHPRFRKLVSGGFTPRVVADHEVRIREIVGEILDSVARKGECDFVRDVAAELPLRVICEFLGVEMEDRQQVFELSNRMLGSEDPDYGNSRAHAAVAGIQMFQFAYKLLVARREEPRDDLVTAMISGEVAGKKLSDLEFGSFFLLLAIAGNETTRNLISHGMRLLIANPEARDALLRDPSRIPSAIEEMLRMSAPVMYFRRTATQDVELAGRAIRAGQKVTLWYPSANRDEDYFSDPDRFDIDRHPNEHVAFGVGQHFCLGAHLARLEIRVMFEELLKRLPDIALGGEPKLLRSHFIDGVKSMPVVFTPES